MGTRGIASPGIWLAGARAGSGTPVPPRGWAAGSPWLPARHWPPGVGATGLGTVSLDPALRQSPAPHFEAEPPEGEASGPGIFSSLSTCSFCCHPTLQQACSHAGGQGSSPRKGSCSLLRSSLSFRGPVPHTPDTARALTRCQAWVHTLPGIIRQ